MDINETTKLVKIITDEDEKALSKKLYNYCLNELEDLQSLTEWFSVKNPDAYEFYNIQDQDFYNDQDKDGGSQFWDDNFLTPYSAISAIGAHYNYSDNYRYKGTDGLYYSCNSLKDFYNKHDIEYLTSAIIRDLKGNTEEETTQNFETFKISMEYPQEVLLNALK